MTIVEQVAAYFSGTISVNEMTQDEIHQAIPLAKKQLQDLIGADETPPRELMVLPECRTRQ